MGSLGRHQDGEIDLAQAKKRRPVLAEPLSQCVSTKISTLGRHQDGRIDLAQRPKFPPAQGYSKGQKRQSATGMQEDEQ
jgi:hypothetical protein